MKRGSWVKRQRETGRLVNIDDGRPIRIDDSGCAEIFLKGVPLLGTDVHDLNPIHDGDDEFGILDYSEVARVFWPVVKWCDNVRGFALVVNSFSDKRYIFQYAVQPRILRPRGVATLIKPHQSPGGSRCSVPLYERHPRDFYRRIEIGKAGEVLFDEARTEAAAYANYIEETCGDPLWNYDFSLTPGWLAGREAGHNAQPGVENVDQQPTTSTPAPIETA